MTERRGTKALELWCRRITDGYPGVNVQNMTTSWRDGLAFCAMIHHFRPDLIDFDSLNKDDVYGNNEMAFRTAAEHLGIPALLDAEDMASCSVPDRLSILTYLSQFYQSFGGSSPSRLALSRTQESSNEGISPVVAESTKPKMGPRAGMRREPCAVCGMPVFLAEKLVISRTPYHRTCFRCARCENQLTPGNYYETEEGQYCCETCPDEEKSKTSGNTMLHEAYNDALILGHEAANQRDNDVTSGYQRSLSDEEKTVRSARMTEETSDRIVRPSRLSISELTKNLNEPPVAENISQTAQMRLNFMASHMLSENNSEDTKKSSANDDEYSSGAEHVEKSETIGSPIPGDSFFNGRSPEGATIGDEGRDGRVDATKMPSTLTNHRASFIRDDNFVFTDRRSDVCDIANDNDHLDDRLIVLGVDDKSNNSSDTATSEATQFNNLNSYLDDKEESVRQDTKDVLGPDIDPDATERRELIPNTSQCLSLVQRRLQMFEKPSTNVDETKKIRAKINSFASTIVDRNSFVDENTIETEIREETESDDKSTDRRDISFENEEIYPTSRINNDVQTHNFENPPSPNKMEKTIPPTVPKRSTAVSRKPVNSGMTNREVTVINARGVDLSDENIYPEDLNPFKSDDEEETETCVRNVETSGTEKVSTNPFGSSDEDEEEEEEKVSSKIISPPRPAARSTNVAGKKSPEVIEEETDEAPTKRRLKAPQIHLNPFWSDDDEEPDSEDDNGVNGLPASTPVPKPRTITQTSQRRMESDRSEIYASNSSLGSIGSSSTPGGTCRKKKPAPPPPVAKELFASGGDSSLTLNRKPYMGSNNSLHITPRARKTKPAPPPPTMPTSTPRRQNLMANLTLMESPISDVGKTMDSGDYKTWDDLKIGKDEANRNKQSMTTISCNETSLYGGYADKSVEGKWKRKKGPAPARPIPHRRKIKVMSPKEVKLELDEIEVQQQGLEKQGVRLEQLIRDKAESGNAAEETNLGMDVEELVLELFVLVNEKNELFRRQAELMLLRRQQRLEEEHADVEYQIRCLLCQPEATKTDFDKQREETLIQRLVEIVERRNEIVDCLEMDRRREVEEDRSINTRMGLYTAKNKEDCAKEPSDDGNHRSVKSKKTKLKEKAKEKILRKGHKKDADKDVDETEVKLKRQNKRKWF